MDILEKRNKLAVLRGLILMDCVFMFLLLVPIAHLLNPINPMQLAFITWFDLTNETEKPIYITPIGTAGYGRNRMVMRQFTGKMPAFKAKEQVNLPVKPGETIRVFYESDDYCLSEMAVLTQVGGGHQLRIYRGQTGCDMDQPVPAKFRITKLAKLPPLEDNIKEMIAKPQQKVQTVAIILSGIGVLAVPVFFYLLRLYRRLKTDVDVDPIRAEKVPKKSRLQY